MENVEIAHLLDKYADLLEIQGADLFRIQAYRNAARTIESLSQSVTQLLEAGKDLRKLKLPGIRQEYVRAHRGNRQDRHSNCVEGATKKASGESG